MLHLRTDGRLMNIIYLFICLRPDGLLNTRRRLFFYALNISLLLKVQHLYTMVNCFIVEKDQPHIYIIALEKFFVL